MFPFVPFPLIAIQSSALIDKHKLPARIPFSITTTTKCSYSVCNGVDPIVIITFGWVDGNARSVELLFAGPVAVALDSPQRPED